MRYNSAFPMPVIKTAEGGTATPISDEQQLRRLVMSCLLWEDNFYTNGKKTADLIKEYAHKVSYDFLRATVLEAKLVHKLRSIPLFLTRELLRHAGSKGRNGKFAVANVCTRPDMMVELLAMYWEGKRTPLCHQLKRGLAASFRNFDEYQLAKWDREGPIRLRDVLFLCHAKPKDDAQAEMWKRLIAGNLAVPDTWEVRLSAGADKKESWEKLLREGKLGYTALLKNLRNMVDANVDEGLVRDAITAKKGAHHILPWQFMAAIQHAPMYLPQLDKAMVHSIKGFPKLPGKTVLLVDNSGSMHQEMSGRSKTLRFDAAAGLAILAREVCESVRIFVFSDLMRECHPFSGYALRGAIYTCVPVSGTYLGQAIQVINQMDCDRLIVITDEQSHDNVPQPKCKGYMINVGSEKNGVGYCAWTHIDGFSQNTVRYIAELEGVPYVDQAEEPETAV